MEPALTLLEQKSLSRKGDAYTAEILYRYNLTESQIIIPSIQATRYDLHGDAMKFDEYLFQLSYILESGHWQTILNFVIGRDKHHKANPIPEFSGKTQRDNIYGATLSLVYDQPFGWKDWGALISIAGVRADSNIHFYDTDIAEVTLGLLYHF